jgi:hypothetical protein
MQIEDDHVWEDGHDDAASCSTLSFPDNCNQVLDMRISELLDHLWEDANESVSLNHHLSFPDNCNFAQCMESFAHSCGDDECGQPNCVYLTAVWYIREQDRSFPAKQGTFLPFVEADR